MRPSQLGQSALAHLHLKQLLFQQQLLLLAMGLPLQELFKRMIARRASFAVDLVERKLEAKCRDRPPLGPLVIKVQIQKPQLLT